MTDVSKKELNELVVKLTKQQYEFEEATKCCAAVIHGMNNRVERIEKWILDLANEKH